MDVKHELVDLCNREIEAIHNVREDMDKLIEISDDHLQVLIEKAYRFRRIQDMLWDDASEGKVSDYVRHRFLPRAEEIRNDLDTIKEKDQELKEIEKDIKRQEHKRSHAIRKEKIYYEKEKNLMFKTMGIGFLAAVSVLIHLLLYHMNRLEALPIVVILIGVPAVLALVFGKQWNDVSNALNTDLELDRIERKIDTYQKQLEEDQDTIKFLKEKFDIVFCDVEGNIWELYEDLERTLQRLMTRTDWRKAQSDYRGIMEIIQFKQIDYYQYLPEIFLDEEIQNGFMNTINNKMMLLDEYVVQTMETT